MFFFPYATDAPIYHWPVTTVVMIVLNCFVFLLELADPTFAAQLLLTHGQGLHPIEWLTCNFAHIDLMHLGVNMMFLWSFGLIVEGKLGWWKMLATYLGIGVVHGAIVQILMLGSSSPGSLGASAAIFGLMVMALVWAPENDLNCILVLFMRVFRYELSIRTVVGLFLVLQITVVVFTGGAMSSEFLHAVGALVGLPVALWMLKAKIVDCENWDIFSVWKGYNKMSPEERRAAEMSTPAYQKKMAAAIQAKQELAQQQIPQLIASGQVSLALKAHQRMSRDLKDWSLPEPDLNNLIVALHNRRLWVDSFPLIREYLARYPENAAVMRLRLARIFAVEQRRPAQALVVLHGIDANGLQGPHREYFTKLHAMAEQLQRQKAGEYEVVEDW